MTDKEIIKALGCCQHKTYSHCKECVFFGPPSCNSHLATKALDLINRQQAEIENYIKVAEYQQNLTLKKSFEIKELKAEIERLQTENNQFADIGKMYSEIKAEAIKELLDKIEKQAIPSEDDVYWVELDDIYNLVKEMVGDTE